MPWLSLMASLVDFCGTLVIIVTAVICLWGYLRVAGAETSLDPLRLRLAEGLILALSFKAGAGLIRTITVGTFHQFGAMLLVVALRFFLGYFLKAQLRVRQRSLQ